MTMQSQGFVPIVQLCDVLEQLNCKEHAATIAGAVRSIVDSEPALQACTPLWEKYWKGSVLSTHASSDSQEPVSAQAGPPGQDQNALIDQIVQEVLTFNTDVLRMVNEWLIEATQKEDYESAVLLKATRESVLNLVKEDKPPTVAKTVVEYIAYAECAVKTVLEDTLSPEPVLLLRVLPPTKNACLGVSPSFSLMTALFSDSAVPYD